MSETQEKAKADKNAMAWRGMEAEGQSTQKRNKPAFFFSFYRKMNISGF